jgi:hypothetical protein
VSDEAVQRCLYACAARGDGRMPTRARTHAHARTVGSLELEMSKTEPETLPAKSPLTMTYQLPSITFWVERELTCARLCVRTHEREGERQRERGRERESLCACARVYESEGGATVLATLPDHCQSCTQWGYSHLNCGERLV